MNRAAISCVLTVLALSLGAGAAEGGGFNLSAGVAVVSSYIWRGIEFDSEPSLQPDLTLGFELSAATTLEVNGWWNVALDDHGSDDWKDMLFEQDFTVTLSHSIGPGLSLSAGYVYYSNPRSDVAPGSESWQTDELFAGMEWSGGPKTLALTVYRDTDKVRGWYGDLAYDLSFPVSDRASFDMGAHLGFADGMAPNPDAADEASWYLDDGLVDGNLFLGFGIAGERFGAGIGVNYSARFDDFEDATGQDERYLWGSVSVSYSF